MNAACIKLLNRFCHEAPDSIVARVAASNIVIHQFGDGIPFDDLPKDEQCETLLDVCRGEGLAAPFDDLCILMIEAGRLHSLGQEESVEALYFLPGDPTETYGPSVRVRRSHWNPLFELDERTFFASEIEGNWFPSQVQWLDEDFYKIKNKGELVGPWKSISASHCVSCNKVIYWNRHSRRNTRVLEVNGDGIVYRPDTLPAEEPNAIHALTYSLTSALQLLASFMMPCGYRVQAKFNRDFHGKSAQMKDWSVYRAVTPNRVYAEAKEARGDRDVQMRPHQVRGHVRRHWAEAGINRKRLPESVVERIRLQREKNVRTTYIAPYWTGPATIDCGPVRYEIVQSLEPNAHKSFDNRLVESDRNMKARCLVGATA